MRPHARDATHEARSGRPPRFAAGLVALSTFLTVAPAVLAVRPALGAPVPPPSEAHRGTPHRSEASHAAPVFAVCPVDPPRRYVAGDFGSPRYFPTFHLHQGEDIFAPFGTKIRAPFDGKTLVSSSLAGGLGVYLFGRNGFAFNAHLSRLGAQGRVKAGTVIGYVGNSGDASGGSPHDHFEWHPKGGPAVDPYPLLQQVCVGRSRVGRRPRHQSAIRFLVAKLA